MVPYFSSTFIYHGDNFLIDTEREKDSILLTAEKMRNINTTTHSNS